MDIPDRTIAEKKLEMNHRADILNFGCQLEDFFIERKYLSMPFTKLTRLQKAISNMDQKQMESLNLNVQSSKVWVLMIHGLTSSLSTDDCRGPKAKHYPDGENDSTRTIYFMRDSNLFACLPLKTGTTNWQKSLAAAQFHQQTGRYLDPVRVAGVYDALPRYHQLFTSNLDEINQGLPDGTNCIQESLAVISADKENLSWMNVRHPFARLLSAWRNKFAKSFKSNHLYMKKYSKPGLGGLGRLPVIYR